MRPLVLLISTLLLAVATMIVAMKLHEAWSSERFPPIPAIAQQLNLATGVTLPKGVIWNGRPYFFVIQSAKQLPNGRYIVVLATR